MPDLPDNLAIAIITSDQEFGQALTRHFEELGCLPGVLDTVDELQGYLDDKYVDVVLLDEPSDEVWAVSVKAQNESEAKAPILFVLTSDEQQTQDFQEAGADMVVPKPVSPVDVQDHLVGRFQRRAADG